MRSLRLAILLALVTGLSVAVGHAWIGSHDRVSPLASGPGIGLAALAGIAIAESPAQTHVTTRPPAHRRTVVQANVRSVPATEPTVAVRFTPTPAAVATATVPTEKPKTTTPAGSTKPGSKHPKSKSPRPAPVVSSPPAATPPTVAAPAPSSPATGGNVSNSPPILVSAAPTSPPVTAPTSTPGVVPGQVTLNVDTVTPTTSSDSGSSSDRPGYGYGDANHDHSGPPGQQSRGNSDDNGSSGHGGSHH